MRGFLLNIKMGRGRKALTRCHQCDKEFLAMVYKLNHGTGKYCSVSCARIGCSNLSKKDQKGENNNNWKGGKSVIKNKGYIYIRDIKKSKDGKVGYTFQHRIIMSEYLNRPLLENETVHHKNGIKDDNRIENLELWASSHPSGQRVSDLISFALEIIEKYGDNPDIYK